jgi:hypothetical protein
MRPAIVILVTFVLILSLTPHAVAIGFGFIENRGQIDEAVRYYTLGSGAAVYFIEDAVVFDLKNSQDSDAPAGHGEDRFERVCPWAGMPRGGCAVYIRFEGANETPALEAREEQVTKYNYFRGKDPSGWQVDVPSYEEVVYHDLWPGVDLAFRENEGALLVRVLAEPGRDPGLVRFRYEGASDVRAVSAAVTRIETPVGALGVEASSLTEMSIRVVRVLGVGDAFETDGGSRDTPSALLWSTYLGGSDWDMEPALAIDTEGNPVMVGWTGSHDFPVTPGAYDDSLDGNDADAFVTKFDATGSTLLWSTFLGGWSFDQAYDVCVDSLGNVTVTGEAWSPDYPTTAGAYDGSHNGGADAFVSRLGPAGNELIWSTYLGGSYRDRPRRVCLDQAGNLVLLGDTKSSDFPTTSGAYDETYGGNFEDAFLCKLAGNGTSLLWSTYLGGSGREWAYGLILDQHDNPVAAGETYSSDFPTTPGAYDRIKDHEDDAFVAKLDSEGRTLLWSTLIGGNSYDICLDLALDSSGDPIVVGWTASATFPTTTGVLAGTLNGWSDAFLSKFDSTGSTLIWSTFLGGSGEEHATGCVVEASGTIVVAGWTGSLDFPVMEGSYDTSPNGDVETYLAKLDPAATSLLWCSYLGGGGPDYANSLIQDQSGNILVAGYTDSPNFPVTPGAYDQIYAYYDLFLSKLTLAEPTGVVSGETTPENSFLGVPTPNPFNPVTRFRFEVPASTPVSLVVYDVSGRRIAVLADEQFEAGWFTRTWDGRDDSGREVTSGIYFVRLEAGDLRTTKKMMLLH